MQRGQEEALERATKKARCEKLLMLKKKSHQVQHEFNEQVADCIKKAKDEMKEPTSEATSTKITQALKEGRELIAACQKMIQTADRSEYGWQVVAEYKADELSSGSEDEKQTEKAEKATGRKAQKKKRVFGKPGSRSFV